MERGLSLTVIKGKRTHGVFARVVLDQSKFLQTVNAVEQDFDHGVFVKDRTECNGVEVTTVNVMYGRVQDSNKDAAAIFGARHPP